jgi:hypothetical protein
VSHHLFVSRGTRRYIVRRREEKSVETGNSLERGENWVTLERLIALARSAHRTELSQQRREKIREELLDRLERERDRRLMARAFAAGASTVLLVGLLLRLAAQ